VYDKWTFHEIPFDDPAVMRAFERFGEIVFEDRNLFLGPQGAAVTSWEAAQVPMVDRDPPGCWLYHFPSFAGIGVPPGSVGRTTDAFAFPAPNHEHDEVVLGGANFAIAFSDRPEVREVMRFLVSPQFGERFFTSGEGSLSANRRFDTSLYDPVWHRFAELLDDALAGDAFRFDGGDLMPTEVGVDSFFGAMKTYLTEGPKSLGAILADLEAAWPDDG
jgi:alpha-glucoside transport system substrate-binding protein